MPRPFCRRPRRPEPVFPEARVQKRRREGRKSPIAGEAVRGSKVAIGLCLGRQVYGYRLDYGVGTRAEIQVWARRYMPEICSGERFAEKVENPILSPRDTNFPPSTFREAATPLSILRRAFR